MNNPKLNLDKALEALNLTPEQKREAYGLTFYEIEPNYCPATDRTFYMEHLWLGNENDGILDLIFTNLVYWQYGNDPADDIVRESIRIAFMENAVTETLSAGEQISVKQLASVLPRLRREYLQRWKHLLDDHSVPDENDICTDVFFEDITPTCMPTPKCILDDKNLI